MIVVDTNVICYRAMPSTYVALADAAWRRDPHWIAPLLWRSEFRNALAGSLRANRLTIASALQCMELAQTVLISQEVVVPSDDVLRLVTQSRCSAYDCEFVALAQQQRIPLVTVDRQVLRAFPAIAISLETFVKG